MFGLGIFFLACLRFLSGFVVAISPFPIMFLHFQKLDLSLSVTLALFGVVNMMRS